MSSSSRNRKDENKHVQLTSRQKVIIQILTKFTASRPVTVAMISEMMGVSSRTILREIPHIEQWMTQNDFHFIRKPGVGLILDESVENQKLILELLEVESIPKEYTKEERRRRILGELLYAEEPLKSYYFTSKFHISEGTLSSDLDEVGRWLESYDIRLIRRPGLGILLEGDERSYRQAIANVVYESIDESQIMQLLCGDPAEGELSVVHNRVFGLLDHDTTSKVEKILMESARRLHIQYTDSAYVGLIVHIGLAIKRIQNNEKIEMEPERLQKLMMLPEFSVAEEISDRLQETFHVHISRGEVGFITMHLSSSRIWPTGRQPRRNIDSINLRQLATQLIEQVEQKIGIILHDSDSLLEDLCNHMAPTISRLSMGMQIENTQLDSIREEYPEIMEATRAACIDILCPEVGIEEVPDSEVSFLVMHFGAALEKKLQQLQTISAVVVCPTGIGTSRILEAGLRKTFPNIDIHGTISAFRIDTKKLREQGIDLIISTVNLTTDYPWICVSPILQAQDRRQLESMMASLQDKKRGNPILQTNRQMTYEDIRDIAYTGSELLNLVENLRFDTLCAAHSRAEIIAKAGTLFADNDRSAADIEAGLYERDRNADTYVKQFHVLMLHCQTNMIDHARFGYVKLDPPLYEQGRVIFGALVMLAPETSEDEDVVAHHLIGAISSLLVENKTFLGQLRSGDWNGSRASIEAGLGMYYKQYLRKRIGVGGK